jgi:N-acetylglucosaminyldiphosphoundecaprenol N-acetyl-beta-D-mannosaminyltransferase
VSRFSRLLSRATGAVLMLPSLVVRPFMAREEDYFLGKSGHIIKLCPAASPFRKLILNAPALWREEVALIGPSLRPASHESDEEEQAVLAELPGLISLFELRNRTGTYDEQQTEIDLEYLRDRSPKRDVGILIRCFLAHLLESGEATPVVPLLGVQIDNLSNIEALDKIFDFTESRDGSQVSFVNAHCANTAQTHAEYLDVLNRSDLCLADGIGVKLGAALSGYRIVENVNGTDLFPRILYRLQEKGQKISLIGAKPGIVDLVVEYIQRTYPSVEIGVVQHGYFHTSEEPSIIQAVAESDSDLLLVALGVPEQDLWLAHHLPELKVGVGIGVGGLFDYYSDTIPRAPSWIRTIGMEWAFRLCQEPGRLWRRYLIGNFLFVFRVLMNRGKGK